MYLGGWKVPEKELLVQHPRRIFAQSRLEVARPIIVFKHLQIMKGAARFHDKRERDHINITRNQTEKCTE